MVRYTTQQLDSWRRDGGVLIEGFFNATEIAAVVDDFKTIFARDRGAQAPLVKHRPGEAGKFNPAQFATFAAIPFANAPALNLIGVHPELIGFAQAALRTQEVHLYQCQAWAKFTGDADYEQPFHCDFVNHTLTVPSEQTTDNSVTILCYFTDVSEAHGPMHYVTRPDSAKIAGPETSLSPDAQVQAQLQRQLALYERSSAAAAGAIFPYGIDVFHRGTNLTAPEGVRYAVMACFKRADNDSIGYHAWPFHHTQPWHEIFDRATPQQLCCFGVKPPGHPFWTKRTLAQAQVRYPNWDLRPYHEALTG
jgi:phytanoyl-CoA dioxygenase PhyH